jgi:peptidyl-prolyl cis-trans isomerase B (cyclophilin B)
VAACGGDDDSSGGGGGGGQSGGATAPTPARAGACKQVAQPHAKPNGGAKPPGQALDAGATYDVVLATNCGDITIRLDQKASPRTAASFASLAKSGFFDDTVFHRIVPGFVIQGGDPTQSGSGGPGYSTIDEVPSDAKYVKGVVAMAKTQAEPAGTSGSQFFVVTGADIGLPPEYAVVGKVTEGLDVVELIGTLGDASEQPTQTVLVEKVAVEDA